ncbi:hypothetical protein VQH23_01885 [Pararoseomonas sp. SCSIO 73927]|uniref:hypothetical protein n=1 Tax=Pararoseomonas sp. SCSIO 73927 TaxID=3114537 RepID=UPI0030CCDFBA
MNPGRTDPDHANAGRESVGAGPAPTRRMTWPAAALLIAALSVLGWGLIALAIGVFWR